MKISEFYIQQVNLILEDEKTKKYIEKSWFYDGKVYKKNDTKEFWRWLFKNVVGNLTDKIVETENIENIKEAIDNKYIINKNSTSWVAIQRGQTQWYEITNKGIDTIVKHFKLEYKRG